MMKMKKISAVYKIVNTITNDCYVGSSNNVKQRWANHKCHSNWKRHPNSKLYQDFQKYGVDKFDFQILAMRDPDQLKETEQEFIEMLQPTYNNYRAKGIDVERRKEYHKDYMSKYQQSNRGKEVQNKASKKYFSKVCFYNGEKFTLSALATQFYKAGIEHPVIEAKKYLEKNNNEEEK